MKFSFVDDDVKPVWEAPFETSVSARMSKGFVKLFVKRSVNTFVNNSVKTM